MKCHRIAYLWVVLALVVPLATEAAGVELSGVVHSPDGKPAANTRIILVELNRSTFTEEDGTFRFAAVPAGFYHVQAIDARYGGQVKEVDVGDEDVEIVVALGYMSHHETLIVSTGNVRGASELVQPVNVLDQNDLTEQMQPTIGETLKSQPGLNSTQYGNGASRPVIRGQGAGRIQVLEGGLSVGDASATSPDHAVALDVLSTERVEILRGPATLLYGNTAVGGVVNTIDERVPDHVPQSPVGGTVELRAGTVADERVAAAELRGGSGYFAYYANAFSRDASDYEIPVNPVVGAPGGGGPLPNSGLETDGATLGVSWVGKKGYVGVAGRYYDTLYGVPVELEEEEAASRADGPVPATSAEGGGIRIDGRQARYDLRGGFDTSFGPFNGLNFSVGLIDYEHEELEGEEVGTRFQQDTAVGRLELRHGKDEPLRGVVGTQFGRRTIEPVGAEAFLPKSTTEEAAVFAVEEIERGPMIYEAGLRLATQNTGAEGQPDRDFSGASGSFGVLAKLGGAYRIGGSISRTERFPRAEELYADGPHLATLTYELGDPDLDPEVSVGVDLSLRRTEGFVSGELNVFANRYQGYIYEGPVFDDLGMPELQDGLPVFQYAQQDAEFAGVELDLHFRLWEAGSQHFGLELISDYVRAEFSDTGEPIPYIPPLRVGTALHYRGARWHASAEIWYYAEQDRVPSSDAFGGVVPPEELGLYGLTATDAYTMVGAHVGYRLPVGREMLHEFLLRGTNLTDTEARNSVSRLKDLVPLPGRDLALVYRLIF